MAAGFIQDELNCTQNSEVTSTLIDRSVSWGQMTCLPIHGNTSTELQYLYTNTCRNSATIGGHFEYCSIKKNAQHTQGGIKLIFNQ